MRNSAKRKDQNYTDDDCLKNPQLQMIGLRTALDFKGKLDDYVVESISGRVFFQLQPQGCIPLEQKIRRNIQRRVYNVLKDNSFPNC